MKTTVGDLIEKIEEIEHIIHLLEGVSGDPHDIDDKYFELAAKHLDEYKDLLWHTKVEV